MTEQLPLHDLRRVGGSLLARYGDVILVCKDQFKPGRGHAAPTLKLRLSGKDVYTCEVLPSTAAGECALSVDERGRRNTWFGKWKMFPIDKEVLLSRNWTLMRHLLAGCLEFMPNEDLCMLQMCDCKSRTGSFLYSGYDPRSERTASYDLFNVALDTAQSFPILFVSGNVIRQALQGMLTRPVASIALPPGPHPCDAVFTVTAVPATIEYCSTGCAVMLNVTHASPHAFCVRSHCFNAVLSTGGTAEVTGVSVAMQAIVQFHAEVPDQHILVFAVHCGHAQASCDVRITVSKSSTKARVDEGLLTTWFPEDDMEMVHAVSTLSGASLSETNFVVMAAMLPENVFGLTTQERQAVFDFAIRRVHASTAAITEDRRNLIGYPSTRFELSAGIPWMRDRLTDQMLRTMAVLHRFTRESHTFLLSVDHRSTIVLVAVTIHATVREVAQKLHEYCLLSIRGRFHMLPDEMRLSDLEHHILKAGDLQAWMGTMTVHVKTRNGYIVLLPCDPSDTIEMIIADVSALAQLSEGVKRMVFNGNNLDLSRTLHECGVVHNSSLTLMSASTIVLEGILVLRDRTEKTFVIEVESDATVDSGKAKLYEVMSVPIDRQCWTYYQKPLHGRNTIGDYFVQQKGSVRVVLRPGGVQIVLRSQDSEISERIHMEQFQSIEDLKLTIFAMKNISPEAQELIFGEAKLETGMLSSHGIGDGSEITLRIGAVVIEVAAAAPVTRVRVFCDATTTVQELKVKLRTHVQKFPHEICLRLDRVILDDHRTTADYGIDCFAGVTLLATTRPEEPFNVKLSGQDYSVNVSMTDKLSVLKTAFFAVQQVHEVDQILFHRGMPSDSMATFATVGFVDGDEFTVHIKQLDELTAIRSALARQIELVSENQEHINTTRNMKIENVEKYVAELQSRFANATSTSGAHNALRQRAVEVITLEGQLLKHILSSPTTLIPIDSLAHRLRDLCYEGRVRSVHDHETECSCEQWDR